MKDVIYAVNSSEALERNLKLLKYEKVFNLKIRKSYCSKSLRNSKLWTPLR